VKYTGSSAVFDYFSGRPDTVKAFDGGEFDAFHIQDGIASYYQLNFSGFFHPLVHDVSFERLRKRLLYSPSFFERKLYPGGVVPPANLIEEFLADISLDPVFFRYNSTVLSRFGLIRCLMSFLRKKHQIIGPNLVLPVSRDEFLGFSRKFFDTVVKSSLPSTPPNTEKTFVVINQCGSFWSPELTKILTGADFIIRVKRNVFDHFAELKLYKGMLEVDSYLRWFNATRLNEIKSSNDTVIDVWFEDLVLNFENFRENLSQKLSIDADIASTYEVSYSAKNVNIYKNVLSKSEINALGEISHV